MNLTISFSGGGPLNGQTTKVTMPMASRWFDRIDFENEIVHRYWLLTSPFGEDVEVRAVYYGPLTPEESLDRKHR